MQVCANIRIAARVGIPVREVVDMGLLLHQVQHRRLRQLPLDPRIQEALGNPGAAAAST